MSDDALVDALARKLEAEAARQRGLWPDEWDDLTEQERGGWRLMACAALEFLTDEARGDDRLVPATEGLTAGLAQQRRIIERVAAERDEARAERDALARWKRDALQVMDGLQDLGRALNVPLGKRITAIQTAKVARDLVAERDALAADRDRWVRLFNRLDAAITHHRRDAEGPWQAVPDEALWAARDRVLKDAAEPRP